MKLSKRFACLVTLCLACGHPLLADTAPEFREWVDNQGRKTVARFVRMNSDTTVEIERKDNKLIYIIPLSMFSEADRKYVAEVNGDKSPSGQLANYLESRPELKEPDDAFWTLLSSSGSQPTFQSEMKFSVILELMNQRFAVRDIKTTDGKPMSIRTEPAELAERITVPRNMQRMRMDDFMREVARLNDVSVKLDNVGAIVLVDTAKENYRVSQAKKASSDFTFYNQAPTK